MFSNIYMLKNIYYLNWSLLLGCLLGHRGMFHRPLFLWWLAQIAHNLLSILSGTEISGQFFSRQFWTLSLVHYRQLLFQVDNTEVSVIFSALSCSMQFGAFLSKSGVGKGTVIKNTAARYTAIPLAVTIAVLKIFAVRYYGTNFGTCA